MTLQASGAISLFDVNTELGLTRTAQLGLLCTNVRTLFAVASGAVGLETGYGKSNTSVPGAPTGVSASATSYSSASVSFSAPACTGHLTIDSYQAISSPGCITATGSSPISVTGLSGSTSYTFRVRAHNSKGYGCYSSSSGSITTPSSTYSISAALVAGGGAGWCGGGGAGGVIKSTSLTLTIGTQYTITVGSGARLSKGTNSSVGSLATACGGGKSSYYQSCRNGGSGGAPSTFCTSLSAGIGVPGQGNNSGGPSCGYSGGPWRFSGGGGAGAVGCNWNSSGGGGGIGGIGVLYPCGFGWTYPASPGSGYAGGGGGGGARYSGAAGGCGGGGHGHGGNDGYMSTACSRGKPSTGGGGGGNNPYDCGSSQGGSGNVVLKIPNGYYTGTYTGGPSVITSVGGYTILYYTASGSYTA